MPLKETEYFPKKNIPEYSVNDNSVDDDDEIEVYDDGNNEDRLHLLHICYVVGTQFACIT